MALRDTCLYKGKPIHISSIYTVVNGKQINIPGKVERLRALGRAGELLCPCGCGAQLILVAGEKGLREQHFRIKSGTGSRPCRALEETDESICAKIVLKCWLDDKLGQPEIEYAVPAAGSEGNERKFEYTFLIRARRLGLVYWRIHSNILRDRADYLSSSPDADRIIYVTSLEDAPDNGQYPEFCMTIQRAQGYCLFAGTDSDQYEDAHLLAGLYVQNRHGEWEMLKLSEGPLSSYRIAPDGIIYPSGSTRSLSALAQAARETFENHEKVLAQQEEEEKRRLLQERERQEQTKKELLRKLAAEKEAERQKKEQEARERVQKEKAARQKEEEEDRKQVLALLDQNEKPAEDRHGRRWYKCRYCNTVGTDKDFPVHGGPYGINGGVCSKCAQSGRLKQENHAAWQAGVHREQRIGSRDPSICPLCGGKLRKVSGRYGDFLGCSNYPRCRYTRRIRP